MEIRGSEGGVRYRSSFLRCFQATKTKKIQDARDMIQNEATRPKTNGLLGLISKVTAANRTPPRP